MAENGIDTIDVLKDSIDAGEKRIHQVDRIDYCQVRTSSRASSNS